jgi:hypothetical protein
MSSQGIEISALSATDTVKMESSGMKQNAPVIHLNDGSQGAARKEDLIKSTMVEDSPYWTWVTTRMTWPATHVHNATTMGAPTTPPSIPFPGSTPSSLTGKIITASGTVIIGD